MRKHHLRILQLEDNLADARLTKIFLEEAGLFDFQIDRVVHLSEALNSLGTNSYDLIIADLHVPDSRGLETVEKLVGQAPSLPVVVCSGMQSDEVATRSVELGADDYILAEDLDSRDFARSILFAYLRRQRA